mgnify:CR=1 FL=1
MWTDSFCERLATDDQLPFWIAVVLDPDAGTRPFEECVDRLNLKAGIPPYAFQRIWELEEVEPSAEPVFERLEFHQALIWRATFGSYVCTGHLADDRHSFFWGIGMKHGTSCIMGRHSAPDNGFFQQQRRFDYFDGEGNERVAAVTQVDARWRFDAGGPVQPFEDESTYKRRPIRNCFTVDDLRSLLERAGIPVRTPELMKPADDRVLGLSHYYPKRRQ